MRCSPATAASGNPCSTINLMIESFSFVTEAEWLAALRSAFLVLQREALARRPILHVALSGGSTPGPFYRALANEPLRWERIEWWMGDERYVPSHHPASNGRMANDNFAEASDRFRFHPWNTELAPDEAAQRYEGEMRESLGDPPAFDLILLGLGSDGHTASLFPGSPALGETGRDAVAAPGPPPYEQRLTLTYPALDRAREAWFLIGGGAKEEMVHRLLDGDEALPPTRIRCPVQKIFWLRAAPAAPPPDLSPSEEEGNPCQSVFIRG